MSTLTRKRPKIISIVCVIGFILSAGQIITISAPSIRDVALWYPVLYGAIISMRFISLVGVWHMKKWGAEFFTYVALAKIITQVLVNDFNGVAKADAFFSLVLSILFMSYYKRMGRNL